MENEYTHREQDIKTLLLKFNNRDSDAFGEIYSLLFKEMYYFHRKLFINIDSDPEDLIQDLFFKIWTDRRLQFETISKLKSFLFTSISNRCKTLYMKQKTSSNAILSMVMDDDYLVVRAVEAEIYSLVPSILEMLPEDCAESFRLFIEGYTVKEVAEELNKPLTTIYSQREKAISILRKKVNKNKLISTLLLEVVLNLLTSY